MSLSDQYNDERGHLGAKGASVPRSYPPITRKITLPNVVAVRYLAEVSGQDLVSINALMTELRIFVDVDRSVDFGAAQRILRHFGIWAERGAIDA
jgi:hypothetical protein